MAAVTPERIERVAHFLWRNVYEKSFRGKSRGRFLVTREQLKTALNVQKLHGSTIELLQEEALQTGLVIIDLDDVFVCVETKVLRGYRRPPGEVFERLCREMFPEDAASNEDVAEEDE